MSLRIDYHVHLRRSPCTAKEMTAVAILDSASDIALEEIGLINHLHPVTDLAIFREGRDEIDSAKEPWLGKVLYGAEIDLLDQQGQRLTGRKSANTSISSRWHRVTINSTGSMATSPCRPTSS